MSTNFMTLSACAQCNGRIERPVGAEEKHIWARLALESGIWCAGCGGTKELKKDLIFCSPECLGEYVMSPAYQHLKDRIREEAAEAARRIRPEDGQERDDAEAPRWPKNLWEED